MQMVKRSLRKVLQKSKLNYEKLQTTVVEIEGNLTPMCIKWVPGYPSTIFLAIIFTQKMPESSGSIYSSILMLENI